MDGQDSGDSLVDVIVHEFECEFPMIRIAKKSGFIEIDENCLRFSWTGLEQPAEVGTGVSSLNAAFGRGEDL